MDRKNRPRAREPPKSVMISSYFMRTTSFPHNHEGLYFEASPPEESKMVLARN